MSEKIQGGCHCGALRYEVEALLTDVAHCHCSICRRCSGAVAVTWATVPAESFRWLSGAPNDYHSTPGCTRSFCGRCGAQLTFRSEAYPQTLDLTIATLDHPERVRPDRHIWTKSRLPWLHLDEQLPEEEEERL
ncbi:Glutathione-dependent formaldehyde-activating enzyme [compost metagenome]